MKEKQLTPMQKAIIEQVELGFSVNQICKILKMNHATVFRNVKNFYGSDPNAGKKGVRKDKG